MSKIVVTKTSRATLHLWSFKDQNHGATLRTTLPDQKLQKLVLRAKVLEVDTEQLAVL